MTRCTQLLKALSDSNRLRMVLALMQNESLCACHLRDLIAVKGATASKHLSILVESGILDSRKQGRWVHYRIRSQDRSLAPLLEWVQNQATQEPGLSGSGNDLSADACCRSSIQSPACGLGVSVC
jgi:DNA-binding transcriptional ArsR family regulator